jgi:hypothetical protein
MLLSLVRVPALPSRPDRLLVGVHRTDAATMRAWWTVNASQDEVFVNHTPMTADDLFQRFPWPCRPVPAITDVTIVHIERIPNFVDNDMLYATTWICLRSRRGSGKLQHAAWSRSEIDASTTGIPRTSFST